MAVPRPWRIPLGTTGCILLLTPAILGTLVVMSFASYSTYAFSAVTYGVGVLIYFLTRRGSMSNRRGLCKKYTPVETEVELADQVEVVASTCSYLDKPKDETTSSPTLSPVVWFGRTTLVLDRGIRPQEASGVCNIRKSIIGLSLDECECSLLINMLCSSIAPPIRIEVDTFFSQVYAIVSDLVIS